MQEGIIDTVVLIDEAVATSGNYEQFFVHDGKKYTHIIFDYILFLFRRSNESDCRGFEGL